MKRPEAKKIICILILAAALVSGVVVLFFSLQQPKENHYHLSDERLFGISNLDEVVAVLRDSLKTRSAEIKIHFYFKGDYLDDISPFVKELMELAQDETGKPDEGDYIRYQLGGYTFSYGSKSSSEGYQYSIIITPVYYSSFEQEQETNKKVQEILHLLSLPETAGDYEKTQAVHDYLVEHVNYDLVHKKNEYHTVKSTAYGALVNHSATCQGYAAAAYRLLMELGVNCRVITGEGESANGSEYHAWNIVGIDGVYYNMDVTWDDVKQNKEYFLKSEQDFRDHIKDECFDTTEFCSLYPAAQTSLD